MILVSGNIRCMGIFVGVPLGGGVKWKWGWRRRQFLAIWVATSSEPSEIRPAVLCRPVTDCKMNDLERLFDVKMRFRPTLCCSIDAQIWMKIDPLSTDKWLQVTWMTLSGYFMSKCVFGQHFLNQSVWMSKNNTTSATLRCSVHWTSVSQPKKTCSADALFLCGSWASCFTRVGITLY